MYVECEMCLFVCLFLFVRYLFVWFFLGDGHFKEKTVLSRSLIDSVQISNLSTVKILQP